MRKLCMSGERPSELVNTPDVIEEGGWSVNVNMLMKMVSEFSACVVRVSPVNITSSYIVRTR